MSQLPRIAELGLEPLDIELTEPFGIATGSLPIARNVLVRLVLDDGSVGLGEAAPFPPVSGETQAQTLKSLSRAAPELRGRLAPRWRHVAAELRELLPDAPAARCALETALLDALCRRAGLSLLDFFGGRESTLTTDITITTGDLEHARRAAARATKDGFTTLKIKIGGVPHDEDVGRLRSILEVAPGAKLVLDANASLAADEAVAIVEALGDARQSVVLFEQPTPREDLDGMRRVRERAKVPVAADEGARSAQDVAALCRADAVDVVNLKITKTGIAEALDMIGAARAHGLGLMIGGMVESVLAMTTSACIAAGHGGFSFVDLDTPLFMAECPLSGGFTQQGPLLSLEGLGSGHGVALAASPSG